VPAAIWKIVLEQGETWRPILTIQDSGGDPVDLTAYTARMHVRESIDSPTPLLALTSGPDPGGITLGGAAGTLALYLSATATAALVWSHAIYDLEIESPSGDVTRLLKGEIEVNREVTR
jgi:hypothetical protein